MEAIVFDWDGTLVDTLPGLLEANVAVLGDLGVAFDEQLYRRHYAPDWRAMYRAVGVPEDDIEPAGRRWVERVDAQVEVEAFPGVPAALERLRSAGYRLGLVTAGHRQIVSTQIEQLGLADLLGARIHGDDLAIGKPDPEPLRRVLRMLHVADRPDLVVYVGDAPDDMRMARAAGVRGIGVESLLGDGATLRSAGATEIVPSVVAWVGRLLDRRTASA